MAFADYIKNGWSAAQLKAEAIDGLARDKEGLGPAIGILAIAGACAAIGTLNGLGIIYLPILRIVAVFIGVGIMHFVATLFGGKAEFRNIFVPVSCASLITWVAIVPFVGPVVAFLAGLWLLVVAVVAVERAHGIDRGKAIMAVLAPVALFLIIAFIGIVLGLSLLAFFR